VQNYSGTRFHVAVRRQVRVLDAAALQQQFGIRLPEGVELVGYESDNRMTNIGKQTWTRDGGLLSIWMLGMYKPSSQTTVVIPFKSGGRMVKIFSPTPSPTLLLSCGSPDSRISAA
ncbi:MAG: DUF6786 family protein, partial [Pirellulales bacterium]